MVFGPFCCEIHVGYSGEYSFACEAAFCAAYRMHRSNPGRQQNITLFMLKHSEFDNSIATSKEALSSLKLLTLLPSPRLIESPDLMDRLLFISRAQGQIFNTVPVAPRIASSSHSNRIFSRISISLPTLIQIAALFEANRPRPSCRSWNHQQSVVIGSYPRGRTAQQKQSATAFSH